VTTATGHSAETHSWLDASAIRKASDLALGCVVLVIGAVAILNAPPIWEDFDLGSFPTVISGLLLATGIILLVRGGVFGGTHAARWSLKGLAIIAAAIIAVGAAAWARGLELLLLFGPAEYTALVVLGLAIAVALVRRSRIQAAGLALLGLLLATVGLDPATGALRLTFGLEQLLDGIASPIVCLGLFVVADGAVCLISPSLWLATYARLVDGWAAPRVPTIAAICLRVVAVLAIAAACYLAFEFNASTWDVGLLLLFGAFGLACKLLGWNRLVLLLAFVYSDLLEQSIRQSMLLSNGDPTILWGRPISATLLLLAGGVVVVAALLSARRAFASPNERAVEHAS
jgi:TctA family transporter